MKETKDLDEDEEEEDEEIRTKELVLWDEAIVTFRLNYWQLGWPFQNLLCVVFVCAHIMCMYVCVCVCADFPVF